MYLKGFGMYQLNLGCGYVQPKDWVNVDLIDNGQEHVANLLEGLPFQNDTFDLVLMNHTLQDFHYDELPIALAEAKRVMKLGGTLRILTPSLIRALKALHERDASYFPIADELESTLHGKLARYLFWHGDTRCAFTLSSLTELLNKNGFKHIRMGEFGECELDSREKESLIVVCQK